MFQTVFTMKNYFVSNDTLFVIKKNDIMSALSKCNKCETCQKKKKKTNPLTNEKHVLVVVIFTHVSSSLIFDTNDVISFIYYLRGFSCLDQIFFFLFQNTSSA